LSALVVPWRNRARIKVGFTAARMFDDYYQTLNFTTVDTADRTNFNHVSGFFSFEHNTLNRKQYASTGSQFLIKLRYLSGQELNAPGSTSTIDEEFRSNHDFFRLKISYDKYLNKKGRIHAGVYGETVISNQPFFNNATATLLQAPAFQMIPESRTLFQPQFRAHNYAAGGLKLITEFTNRLELRLEGYVFQPYQEILSDEDQNAYYGNLLFRRYYIGSASLVFHTPIAPIAFSVNYYDQSIEPWSVIFTTGFLIFNRRALD
jgi:NTE family protein